MKSNRHFTVRHKAPDQVIKPNLSGDSLTGMVNLRFQADYEDGPDRHMRIEMSVEEAECMARDLQSLATFLKAGK